MSEARGGLQIGVVPAGGWCEPDTGVCHIDTVADEAVSARAGDAGEVVDMPDVAAPTPAMSVDRHLSLPTR